MRRFRKRLRQALVWGVICGAGAPVVSRAQGALQNPAPLATAPASLSPGALQTKLESAQRAHDLGLLTAAATTYRELLAGTGGDRAAISVALASVLIDAGRGADADAVLQAIPAPHSAGWHLRAGLAALQQRKRAVAQSEWDATKREELSPTDRTWHVFLEAALYDTLPNRDRAAVTKANDLYKQAEGAAPNEFAKARFQLAAERVRLQLGPPTPEAIADSRRNYEQNIGRAQAYGFAQDHAVMLAQAGRRSEAVQFLEQVALRAVAAQDRRWRDDFQFLIGLIGDRTRYGAGRNALLQLLTTGSDAERRRQALQLLADASTAEPERGHFRGELNRLLTATPPHPMRESMLYFRAQLALGERDFPTAENDANTLLRDFPGSPLRVQTFGVLTQAAWEQQRYRLAADQARKTREALPAPVAGQDPAVAAARAQLVLLEAEAWFRAGLNDKDRSAFRTAADSYATVLRDANAGLPAKQLSRLIFQRVLAEIKSGSGEAARVLDELDDNPAFEVENRWEAEWSLARELHANLRTPEALARINRILGEPTGGKAIKPDLRARMLWLQTKLTFDAGLFQQTIGFAEALQAPLPGVDPALRAEITSSVLLQKAQAELALGNEAAALATLQKLRAEHAATDAAIRSYSVEAEHYEAQGKIQEAQVQYTKLISRPEYRNSEYVAHALLRLAILSEQLGQEQNLRDANARLEELVEWVKANPGRDDMMFEARQRQGDVLRRLNEFDRAQRSYEYLINTYPRRPDIFLAHLGLAQTHNARSAADAKQTHAEIARNKFEELSDRLDAPPDVRVEAGYNLGKLLERAGKLDEAAAAWWQRVVHPFLDDPKAPAFEATAKRPYWLARTLIDLGELHERQGNLEQARRAYNLVLAKRLTDGESTARQRLDALFGAGSQP